MLGKFKGVLKENRNKIYYVYRMGITSEIIEDARKRMKVSMHKVRLLKVYLDNESDDEFSLEPYDNCIEAIAVTRR